jgi:hypothetical protein
MKLVQCTSSVQDKNSKIPTSSIKRSGYGPDLIRPEPMGPERIITENDHFALAWFDFFPRVDFHSPQVCTYPASQILDRAFTFKNVQSAIKFEEQCILTFSRLLWENT